MANLDPGKLVLPDGVPVTNPEGDEEQLTKSVSGNYNLDTAAAGKVLETDGAGGLREIDTPTGGGPVTSDDVTDLSNYGPGNVTEALNEGKQDLEDHEAADPAHTSSVITNLSTVIGATVTAALDTLQGLVDNITSWPGLAANYENWTGLHRWFGTDRLNAGAVGTAGDANYWEWRMVNQFGANVFAQMGAIAYVPDNVRIVPVLNIETDGEIDYGATTVGVDTNITVVQAYLDENTATWTLVLGTDQWDMALLGRSNLSLSVPLSFPNQTDGIKFTDNTQDAGPIALPGDPRQVSRWNMYTATQLDDIPFMANTNRVPTNTLSPDDNPGDANRYYSYQFAYGSQSLFDDPPGNFEADPVIAVRTGAPAGSGGTPAANWLEWQNIVIADYSSIDDAAINTPEELDGYILEWDYDPANYPNNGRWVPVDNTLNNHTDTAIDLSPIEFGFRLEDGGTGNTDALALAVTSGLGDQYTHTIAGQVYTATGGENITSVSTHVWSAFANSELQIALYEYAGGVPTVLVATSPTIIYDTTGSGVRETVSATVDWTLEAGKEYVLSIINGEAGNVWVSQDPAPPTNAIQVKTQVGLNNFADNPTGSTPQAIPSIWADGVTSGTPGDGDFIEWSAALGKWVNVPGIGDVDLQLDPQDKYILRWSNDDQEWKAVADLLADNEDVQITSPQFGDQLVYDGTQWVNVDFAPRLFDAEYTATGRGGGILLDSLGDSWNTFDAVGYAWDASTGKLTFDGSDAGIHQFNLFIEYSNYSGGNNEIVTFDLINDAGTPIKSFSSPLSNQTSGGRIMYSICSRVDGTQTPLPEGVRIEMTFLTGTPSMDLNVDWSVTRTTRLQDQT